MLIFSKLKGGYWPNCNLVADKCMLVVQDDSNGLDCSQYMAGNTPLKTNGYVDSQPRGGMQQMPDPVQYNDYDNHQDDLRVKESGNASYNQKDASKFNPDV